MWLSIINLKIKYICTILLLSNFFISCHEKLNEEEIYFVDENVQFLDNSYPDSIKLLLPTLACSECLISSKNLISTFSSKDNLEFIIISTLSNKDSKIIYGDELRNNDNVKFDSLKYFYPYVEDEPKSIWILIFENNCTYRVKINGGDELGFISYLNEKF